MPAAIYTQMCFFSTFAALLSMAGIYKYTRMTPANIKRYIDSAFSSLNTLSQIPRIWISGYPIPSNLYNYTNTVNATTCKSTDIGYSNLCVTELACNENLDSSDDTSDENYRSFVEDNNKNFETSFDPTKAVILGDESDENGSSPSLSLIHI